MLRESFADAEGVLLVLGTVGKCIVYVNDINADMW